MAAVKIQNFTNFHIFAAAYDRITNKTSFPMFSGTRMSILPSDLQYKAWKIYMYYISHDKLLKMCGVMKISNTCLKLDHYLVKDSRYIDTSKQVFIMITYCKNVNLYLVLIYV